MTLYRVVFHVDEMMKWDLALKNVANLIEGLANDQHEIAVLANSEAVKAYHRTFGSQAHFESMCSLHQQGVVFIACNNALAANRLQQSDLHGFVEVVPVGVLELIAKQHAGYAYIKP